MDPESPRKGAGTTVDLAVPVKDGDLFKHGATEHVLSFLSDNPDIQLSIRQLADVVPYSKKSARKAVDVLEANGLVTTTSRENARLTQINRGRLNKPDDPVLSVPQEGFHLPIRSAELAIDQELEAVEGIVLFGSVARGDADRQSDIDIWVLVREDPARQQHRANKLAQRLSEVGIPRGIDLRRMKRKYTNGDSEHSTLADFTAASREGSNDIPADAYEEELLNGITRGDQQLLSQFADTQRYTFEIVVESPKTVLSQLDEIDPELFMHGITLRGTETLAQLKQEVVNSE